MKEIDVHLAVAAFEPATQSAIENEGFVEDVFLGCQNCRATRYHATFRGNSEAITTKWWDAMCEILRRDPTFNGVLEQETLVRKLDTEGQPNPGVPITASLAIQSCPPHTHKICDVHVGVRADAHGRVALDWLDQIGIASFTKNRHDGSWRIYTATFNDLESGERFFDVIKRSVPRDARTRFKIKLERIEHVLRHPCDAVTLPVTYANQLDAWIRLVSVNATT